jgi:superfamily II DNA or RNA helicase
MQIIQRLPDRAYLDTWLWVPKAFCNVVGVQNSLTFLVNTNDEAEKVRELRLWRETSTHLLVPRSLWRTSELPFPVVDCRPQEYVEVDFRSKIKLDHQRANDGTLIPTGFDLQQRALEALIEHPGGILQLACGKGKTVIFLALAAALRVPTLVVIDNTTLLHQWQREVGMLLDVPGGVGLIQGPVFDWKKGLVLTTYHTIAARADELPEEVRRWFGLIGWDEGHHISAPTFAKSADLFYGKRVALTATPVRVDGTHVVYEFHVGPVIFKDLTTKVKPRIYFKWTGVGVDLMNPTAKIRDKNNEIHLSMLYGHLGSLPAKLDMIVNDIQMSMAHQRKQILVLSNSVATVMNVATRLIRGAQAPLYTDIPTPTPAEVGETVEPIELSKKERKKLESNIEVVKEQLELTTLNPLKRNNYQCQLVEMEAILRRSDCFRKIESMYRSRQLAFIRDLQKSFGDIGVMIGDIDAKDRIHYARNSRVILAIMKYGKEGLDAPRIDTVLVLDPFSQRNGMQQLMGRCIDRGGVAKFEPVVVVYEDNIPPIISMCKKLRQHLSEWSHEDGGPFSYQLVGHPKVRQWNTTPIFATG